jgi:hypothetical protein
MIITYCWRWNCEDSSEMNTKVFVGKPVENRKFIKERGWEKV